MLTQHAAIEVDDFAAGVRVGADFANDTGIIAIGHETDVLTVGLHRHNQPELLRDRAHLRLGHTAQRKAQIIKLRLRCGKQEIALVAREVCGAVQLGPIWSLGPANIMAGCQAICTQLACQPKQIGKFYPHVAADARDRCSPRHIFVGKMVDNRFAELAFMVEHIMRDAKLVGDGTGIANILPSTAGPGAFDRATVVVKLQRYANSFGTGAGSQCCNHRRINATRHRNHDSFAR